MHQPKHYIASNLDHAAKWGKFEIGELASSLDQPCPGSQLRRNET